MIPRDVLHFRTPPERLRAVAFIEGFTYLVLLFVAVPLKYLAHQPWPVRIVGSLHGTLFLELALLTFVAMLTRGKSFAWGARIAIAAFIPFGTFALDRDLRADVEAWRDPKSSSPSSVARSTPGE